ncbi:hypothetical protein [Acinetobacter variabilis]|uniref:HD domain-containing protein n=1 Tax=Acinetobacter variabilis TaxID=70346 RepID=UPI0028AFE558|nr:hypothetical protein [Acinetobacter variabilis]
MTSHPNLLPLEKFLQVSALNKHVFPAVCNDYFARYMQIKNYLDQNVYSYIHAGTSSEDGGVYTDHSIDHFNAVIKYLGKLINIDETNLSDPTNIFLTPYEVFVTLVSILLHDAGNIHGRQGHERQTLAVFRSMGDALCPDAFEANLIAKIAQAHGGKIINSLGNQTQDTISSLVEEDEYGGFKVRARLLAALVRFADEICEDRTRAANYLMKFGRLPKFSEIYHKYANSISSVDVDISSKRVALKIEVVLDDVLCQFGKGSSTEVEKVYLIDEINSRLEKMFKELCYCRNFMIEACPVNKIRANLYIYDHDMNIVESKTFELDQAGYPSDVYSFSLHHPDWNGLTLMSKYNVLEAEEK